MEITKAIKRPFQDVQKWIIGCALNIIPIVNFFSAGYILESANLTLKRKETLPVWQSWGDLFVKGLLTFFIGMVFMLPAFILLLIAGVKIFASMFSYGMRGSEWGFLNALFQNISMSIGYVAVALALGIVACYLLPAAILGYVSSEKLGEAFKMRTVLKKSFTEKYFLAWVISCATYFILYLVLGWFWFVGHAIAGFTAGIISMTLLAEAYRK